MAGSVGGYDSAAELARIRAEEARRRAEEEARRRAEEEARRRVQEEAKARQAQEAQEAEEAQEAQEAQEAEEAQEAQEAAMAQGSIWDGELDAISSADIPQEYADAFNEEFEFGLTAYANEVTTQPESELPPEIVEWGEEHGIDINELNNKDSKLNALFKEYYSTSTDFADVGVESVRDLDGFLGFFDWYETTYKVVEDVRHENAAVMAFGIAQGMDVPAEMSFQAANYAPDGTVASYDSLRDIYAGQYYFPEGCGLITSEDGLLQDVQDYKSELSTVNGDTVSTITFTKDGVPVTITTVFKGDSTEIASQTHKIGDDTTTVNYNEDGSFVVKYPDGTDKTSAELTLARINSYGYTLEEDMAGNNELSKILVGQTSVQGAYDALEVYCGGDSVTARKLFNVIYAKDGISVDENMVFKNSDGEEISSSDTKNPLKNADQTVVTDRLFDYRAQDRVLSADILRAFSTTSKKQIGTDENNEPIYDGTLVVNGVDTGFPESGTEYYIDPQGNLCLNTYTMSADDNLNLYMTSVVTNAADDSQMYTETALYYIGTNGEQRVSLYREDQNGHELFATDETVEQYQRRVLVERNYSPDSDSDDDNISELNLSSEQIEQLYSLKMKDGQYSEIIMQYGYELNGQGFFDHVHDFLKKTFDKTGINTERLSEEVYATTSMVPVMENFIAGNTEEALQTTQEEFERRLGLASSVQDVYDLATLYYGEEHALEFVNEYLRTNPQVIKYNAAEEENFGNYYFETTSAEVVKDGDGLHLEFTYNAKDEYGICYTRTATKDLSYNVNSSRATDLSAIETCSANAPQDFREMYTFWTRGGDYTPENITTYQQASLVYSDYNQNLMGAQYLEEALSKADTPEKVLQVFMDDSSSEDEAIARFNEYYSNIFAKNPSITLGIESMSNRCTGLRAEKNEDGSVSFIVDMTDAYGNPLETPMDSFTITNAINGLNGTISKNKLNQKAVSEEFMKQNYPDFKFPDKYPADGCKDDFEYFTKYINDQYFDAYENLYGDTELRNLLNEYITDMDTYASKLTQVVQMGAIGLSFVCPAFGMVAMAAGFIDNGIDLVNMATNKRADNYGEWLKQTAFEAFCVVGGMALGGLCNRIGGKVTEALLTDSSGVAHPLRAQILGTATEVGLDVTSGMMFDYATNMMMYGEADWNFSGNMFSGMLDIISGMRGYHALKSSLDMSKITIPAAGAATLLIADGSGGQVEFKCAGVDPNGRLVYSDGTGRVVVFDDSPNSPIKPSDVTQSALEGIGDNPYIAQRIQQEGLVYDPANGTYRNANMDEVKIETFTDANGTTYIRESVPGEGYSRILPTDNIRQGNDANCGFLATVNSELRTQQGVDSMFDAVREYPGGELRVVTPDGREIKLDVKADDGLSAVYRDAITKVTGVSDGFADEIAGSMGLNPVRVEPGADGFTRGQLDNMAQMVANGDALSVGVRYPDGTGHYMTVQEVYPETGTMKVYDSATDEVRIINVNDTDGEFKVEEVAGGSTREVPNDMNTPRSEGAEPYGAPPTVNKSQYADSLVNAADGQEIKIGNDTVLIIQNTDGSKTMVFESSGVEMEVKGNDVTVKYSDSDSVTLQLNNPDDVGYIADLASKNIPTSDIEYLYKNCPNMDVAVKLADSGISMPEIAAVSALGSDKICSKRMDTVVELSKSGMSASDIKTLFSSGSSAIGKESTVLDFVHASTTPLSANDVSQLLNSDLCMHNKDEVIKMLRAGKSPSDVVSDLPNRLGITPLSPTTDSQAHTTARNTSGDFEYDIHKDTGLTGAHTQEAMDNLFGASVGDSINGQNGINATITSKGTAYDSAGHPIGEYVVVTSDNGKCTTFVKRSDGTYRKRSGDFSSATELVTAKQGVTTEAVYNDIYSRPGDFESISYNGYQYFAYHNSDGTWTYFQGDTSGRSFYPVGNLDSNITQKCRDAYYIHNTR